MRAAFALPTDLMVQRHFPVPQARALRMAEVLQAKGAALHMVEWVRWDARLPEQEVKDGIHYRRFLWPAPKGNPLARALFLRKLTRAVSDALAEAQPDGLVLQDGELLPAAVRAQERLDVPLFYDSQEHWVGMVGAEKPLEGRFYDLMERRAARRLAHVYTVSEPIAERFRGLGCPVTLVYNSRDAAAIRPHMVPRAEAKRRLGVPEDSFLLGFVGSISPESGLDVALAAVRGTPKDVRLAVVGGPQEELKRVEAMAHDLGVADRLTLHPPVPAHEAVALACAFDVGLLTLTGSGPNYEYRAPYKLFEYMALGLPTIVSDYPELRRLAVDEAGFALPVPRGDGLEVRRRVYQLREDEALRTELGRKGREAFDATFSGEKQKERLRASHAFWR